MLRRGKSTLGQESFHPCCRESLHFSNSLTFYFYIILFYYYHYNCSIIIILIYLLLPRHIGTPPPHLRQRPEMPTWGGDEGVKGNHPFPHWLPPLVRGGLFGPIAASTPPPAPLTTSPGQVKSRPLLLWSVGHATPCSLPIPHYSDVLAAHWSGKGIGIGIGMVLCKKTTRNVCLKMPVMSAD